jgi:hypothetical protein
MCENFTHGTRWGKFFHAFVGIFPEKPVGIGSAKGLLESMLPAGKLSMKPANCHLNKKTKSVNL